MKDNLILKKYKNENVNGTFNLLEENTFFGSKVIEIEDDIIIDDKSIQYFQYYYNVTDFNDQIQVSLSKNNGYQYYELDSYSENFFILDSVDLKYNNHSIIMAQQSDNDEKFNTKWIIDINTKNILREYIFAKIKERRTFKSLKYNNFYNNDINKSIYSYIELNIFDRYRFDYLDFYVKYTDIRNNVVYSNLILKKFDPKFKSDIESNENSVSNVNIQIDNFIDALANIKINYSQTKRSSDYKFDYYFNIYFKKV